MFRLTLTPEDLDDLNEGATINTITSDGTEIILSPPGPSFGLRYE